MTPWDLRAARVAAMPTLVFRDRLHKARRESAQVERELMEMRLRWKVAEFADLVVRPIVESEGGLWFPDSPFQRAIYAVPPLRLCDRPLGRVAQRLVMTFRGGSKTATSRIRYLHSACYGLDPVMLVVAYNDDKATSWLSPFESWIRKPSAVMRWLYPKLTVAGNAHERRIQGPFGQTVLAAAGFKGGIRGINFGLFRPTTIALDDVEAEENSKTAASREAVIDTINGKVRNTLPTEGRGEIWWLQTPICPGTGSDLALKRDPSMAAWEVIHMPAVTRWPTSERWQVAQQIWRDIDGYSSPEARRQAVLAYYSANAAEMSEGAEVLDPHRSPIVQCFLTRWIVGETVWAKDFDCRPRVAGGTIFNSATWKTFTWLDAWTIETSGKTRLKLRDHPRAATWDPSDGGDAGALATGFRDPKGRTIVTSIVLMEGVKKSDQIRTVVRECFRLRVGYLQYEGNSLDSAALKVLEAEIAEVQKQDPEWRLSVVAKWTTENKETRISNLEPPVTSGEVEFPPDLTPAVKAQFDDFDPRRTGNADDAPDAVQRLHELLTTSRTPTMKG